MFASEVNCRSTARILHVVNEKGKYDAMRFEDGIWAAIMDAGVKTPRVGQSSVVLSNGALTGTGSWANPWILYQNCVVQWRGMGANVIESNMTWRQFSYVFQYEESVEWFWLELNVGVGARDSRRFKVVTKLWLQILPRSWNDPDHARSCTLRNFNINPFVCRSSRISWSPMVYVWLGSTLYENEPTRKSRTVNVPGPRTMACSRHLKIRRSSDEHANTTGRVWFGNLRGSVNGTSLVTLSRGRKITTQQNLTPAWK